MGALTERDELQLFGRHRQHTARVISRGSAKLKFIPWPQLLLLRSMRVGVHKPGAVIYDRVKTEAILRGTEEGLTDRNPQHIDHAMHQMTQTLVHQLWAARRLQRRWRDTIAARKRTAKQQQEAVSQLGEGAMAAALAEVLCGQREILKRLTVLETIVGSGGGGGGGAQSKCTGATREV